MIILIGGVSCTGKTLMAQRLLEKYKIPYYSIDHLKMGLIKGTSNCGFTAEDDNVLIAKLMWPILRGIISTAIENEQDLIIEGCYLFPNLICDFDEEYSNHIISVYIGFSEDYIINKFDSNIIAKRSIIEKRYYDENRPVQQFIVEHLFLKKECDKFNSNYFEIADSYNDEILEIYRYIDMRKLAML